MKRLEKHVASLETFVENYLHTNPSVTKSTVGWQIDHSLKVINGVASVLQKSSASDYKKSFNWKRALFLLIKFMPRGRARAPKTVQAAEVITLQDLKDQFEKSLNSLDTLRQLDKHANFKHPFFGVLNLKQSVAFLEIHTNHHLKIVKDCFKKI